MSRMLQTVVPIASLCLCLALPGLVRAEEPQSGAREALLKEATNHVQKARLLFDQARYDEAAKSYRMALNLHRQLFPPNEHPDGHAEIVRDLQGLGITLIQFNELQEALSVLEEALAMCRKLYPTTTYPEGHPDLALSLMRMGFALVSLRMHDKALPYGEQALAMYQRLFPPEKHPDGRPELAASMEIVGSAYGGLGNRDKAKAMHAQLQEMNRRLYPATKFPDGNKELLRNLLSMAAFHSGDKNFDEAQSLFEQALVMAKKLYPAEKFPDGHPLSAHVLHRLALTHLSKREFDKASHYMEQTLAMQRKLMPETRFPEGTLELVRIIHNCGSIQRQQGFAEKALPYFEESLRMLMKLTNREIRIAAEEDGLEFVRTQDWHRNVYLSVATDLPGTAADSYRMVWSSKAAMTRVLEQRHASARAAGAQSAATLTRLKELRQLIDQALRNPASTPVERDETLTNLSDERDRIERELARKLPILAQWNEREKLTERDLVDALPAGSAFVDILAYKNAKLDPQTKKRTDIPQFIAFVVGPRQPIKRVDLGDAGPIQLAVAHWRTSIETNKGEREAAAHIRELVWDKLAPLLPPGTSTLYLSPDTDLCRVPWCALPGSKPGTILLEEFTGGVAVVPHGPALLESLRFPREFTGPESTLLVGGVHYGTTKWRELEGAEREVAALEQIVAGRCETLTKGLPTVQRVAEALASARYAHLATHGFFAAQELANENKRAAELRQNLARQGGQAGQRLTAAKNPLGFNGLVLTNGEIMSGLGIVDLSLDNLKLVTLSACDTGLGEYTGGEGTFGLVRAFHLAGCRNVVASLWKVNDAATAALMAKFYYETWVNKLDPLAALRSAQLTIYHHPELIPDLAGERGAPKSKEALAIKAANPQAGSKRAATKLWAAFVLSGVGK